MKVKTISANGQYNMTIGHYLEYRVVARLSVIILPPFYQLWNHHHLPRYATLT